MTGAHAPLAPSAAHRWMRCPGSVRLIGGRESPETVFSREGTFAHAVAAMLLHSGKRAASAIGHTDGEFTVDAAMADHLQVYLDAVRTIELVEDGILQIEQRVTLIPDKVYGTADAVIYTADAVHVIDLKYGAGIRIDARENEQLSVYGAAALLSVYDLLSVDDAAASLRERLAAWGSNCPVVHGHIVQPRRPDSDGNAHRESVLSLADCEEFLAQVKAAVLATEAPDAPLVAGDHCQFCPAAAECPALLDASLAVARDVFPLGDPEQPVAPPDPSALSVEQLGKLLSSADIVEAWLGAVRQHALERASRVAIPGWKLVDRIANRKWIDEAVAASTLQSIGVEPWAPREVLSPAQAEKVAGKAGKAMITRLVHRPVTGVHLVPESDPRPATNPAVVFLSSPLSEN